MKVLVLGGAGYIGSHTVYELIDKGYNVVIVDNLSTGHIEAVHKDAKFYKGDIRDKEFMNNVLKTEKIDAVIHFAANSLVAESMTNPLKYYDNNLCGTKVLLDAMVENNIDKIVFSSTAAVYGNPKNIPILEDDETKPLNTYGETKLSMEKMFKWVSNAYNMRYVSLRYFNACGAHISGKIGEAHNPESHLIPTVLKSLISDNTIKIFGDDYNTVDGTGVNGIEINIDSILADCDTYYKEYSERKKEITDLSDEYADFKSIYSKISEQIEIVYPKIKANKPIAEENVD